MAGTIRWLGLAFVELVTGDGKVVLFDPWVRAQGNRSCPLELEDVRAADLILVSHDHQDHVGSAVDIARRTGALVGGATETMRRLIGQGLPPEQVVNAGAGYLPGGGVDLGWVKVVAVPAHHTSETGCALGHVAIARDGTTAYHTGDTSLTAEMAIYGALYPLDLLLVPVGGGGTMDALQAAEATRLTAPRQVMPIHFEWSPDPAGAVEDFVRLCGARIPAARILRPVAGKYVPLPRHGDGP